MESLASFRTLSRATPLLLMAVLLLPHAIGTPQPGVKAGNWSHYSVGENSSGNKTLVKSFFGQYGVYANSSYVSLNVTKVSGTNVTLTQDIHYVDGSVTPNIMTVNVSLAIDPSSPPVVIMQNNPPLNSITNGTFLFVSRLVNNLYVTGSSGNQSRYSWDEETGMLVSEVILYTVDSGGSSGTFTFTLAMISTNLWHYVPPKNPPSATPPPALVGFQFAELYVITGVVGSIAIGVLAFTTNRRSKSKRRSRNTRKVFSAP